MAMLLLASIENTSGMYRNRTLDQTTYLRTAPPWLASRLFLNEAGSSLYYLP